MSLDSTHSSFAVIQRGTFQYFMEEGARVSIPYIEAEVGDTYTFDEVLLTSVDGNVTIGTPLVPGAQVEVKVVEQTKTAKEYGFTFRAKSRHRRKYGYRQKVTKVEVISVGAAKVKAVKKEADEKVEVKSTATKKAPAKKPAAKAKVNAKQ